MIDEFGSWETALEYARDVGRSRNLTAKRTKQQLRRLCTTGYDLAASPNRTRNRALSDAAITQFGSWREALMAAGINLANVSRGRPKHLDRETMILWLRDRKASGQSLIYTEVCLEFRDHAKAIRRTFGSWAKATQVANSESSRLRSGARLRPLSRRSAKVTLDLPAIVSS